MAPAHDTSFHMADSARLGNSAPLLRAAPHCVLDAPGASKLPIPKQSPPPPHAETGT